MSETLGTDWAAELKICAAIPIACGAGSRMPHPSDNAEFELSLTPRRRLHILWGG